MCCYVLTYSCENDNLSLEYLVILTVCFSANISEVDSVSDSDTNEDELFAHLERKKKMLSPPRTKLAKIEENRKFNLSTRAPMLDFKILEDKTAETSAESGRNKLNSLKIPTGSRPTRKMSDLHKLKEELK